MKQVLGFTVIEIMVVVVIISLLAAVGIPNFNCMESPQEDVKEMNIDFVNVTKARHPITPTRADPNG